jgi:hypothetical protein
MVEIKKCTKFNLRPLKVTDVRNLDLDERIILRWILEKCGVMWHDVELCGVKWSECGVMWSECCVMWGECGDVD